jgi:hypothetical protein
VKNIQISNFTKIRRVGAELFHADKRTDGQADKHEEPIVALRNFANAPKNSLPSIMTSLGKNTPSIQP